MVQVCYDDKHKRKYYYNSKTKESKWTLPESILAAGPSNKPRASGASSHSHHTSDASEVDFSEDDDLLP